jgi:hypothetical protein
VEIAMLTKELKGLKGSAVNQKIASHGHVRGSSKPIETTLDKYAITVVNSNGKVSSPFAKTK